MSDHEAEPLDQEDQIESDNQGSRSLSKEMLKKASLDGLKKGLNEIEYGEIEYET